VDICKDILPRGAGWVIKRRLFWLDTLLEFWQERARSIASGEGFAQLLGIKFVSAAPNRVELLMPYKGALGIGRVHGGAISALIDIAATAAFWSHPDVTQESRGATVGFTVNFLALAVATDLTATASVRRRGGTLCTGDVSIQNAAGDEVATAIVTYKLTTR
jgi:uncharacterized protein (TIGR00369 family)